MSDSLFVLIYVLLHFGIPLAIAVVVVNYIFGDVTWSTVLTNRYYMLCVFVAFISIKYAIFIFMYLFILPPQESPPPSTFIRWWLLSARYAACFSISILPFFAFPAEASRRFGVGEHQNDGKERFGHWHLPRSGRRRSDDDYYKGADFSGLR